MLLLLWCQLSSFGRIISCCLPAHCQLGLLGIDKLASCVCIELTGLPQFAYTYRISSLFHTLTKDLCKHSLCLNVQCQPIFPISYSPIPLIHICEHILQKNYTLCNFLMSAVKNLKSFFFHCYCIPPPGCILTKAY